MLIVKSVYKYEIANVLGVTTNTLRTYLNNDVLQKKLAEFNYNKRQQIITPAQLKVICDHFGMDLNNFKTSLK